MLVLALVLVVAGSVIEVVVWVRIVLRFLTMVVGWMVLRVGTVGRLTVLGILIVRGRLQLLWMLAEL